MAKVNRETVIAEALDLLDEVGLDAVSTRQLAKRLGVEQPSLYWHFGNKKELLGAMAEAAMAPHATAPLPEPGDDWREWFLENTRSFRRTLLLRRDGARLHAGSSPGPADLGRVARKMAFLAAAGLPEQPARMAMLAASRFTVGSVLEEQAAAGGAAGPAGAASASGARGTAGSGGAGGSGGAAGAAGSGGAAGAGGSGGAAGTGRSSDIPSIVPSIDHDEAFEAGLALIADGLALAAGQR